MLSLVRDQVALRPGAVAAGDATGRVLTYRELWDLAGTLAAGLAAHGVRRGDLVAVGMDPSIDLVVAFLGILRAGAAYLPLDNRAPDDRLAAVLDEAAPGVAVCSAQDATEPRWAARLPADLPLLTVPTEVGTATAPEVGITPEDPAYVAYTSGSTGRAKGVIVPHRAVVRLVTGADYCPVGPDDRVAGLSNPAFDATTFEVWAPLAVGGAVVAVPSPVRLPIDEWVAALAALSITTLFLTTSLFHSIARERPAAFRNLRFLVVGGEQLDAEMVRRVLDADPPGRIVNGYGPTETTTFAAALACSAEVMRDVRRTPIGFPLQNTTLHVLDDELRPVLDGETGELCVGGPAVALGYLARPELTAERFVDLPDGGERVYRTGDLARRLPTGAYEVLGRNDRQVKLRGFRIEPAGVEQVVAGTGLVDAVFVEKVGDGALATLVGFVLPTADTAGDTADDLPIRLRARLADELPDYMIPGRWVVLSEVPLGPTGKADRNRLIAQLATGNPPVEDSAVDDLCRIWQEVLRIPRVDPQDNFLDLGGNSLLAVQVVSRLNPMLVDGVEPWEILVAESAAELGARLRYSGAER
ncbi:non-ribosomal peptide synthetase [Actinokineospora enzanensis]|uniref:non-ribosomal peptide synthetase n=1 Tax=Actinokineospora enzanensis TaxID=155975 RepID=UPI000382E76A|nr:non-ribosomal peptide synthetase [Actinokineospora enzanensis]